MSETAQPRVLQAENEQEVANLPFGTATHLRLFQAPTVIGPGTKITDLTEADFPGYASVVLSALTIGGVDSQNRGIAKWSGLATFIASVLSVTQVINGWYITNAAGDTFFGVGMFTTPVSFANTGDTLLMTPFIMANHLADCDDEFISGP